MSCSKEILKTYIELTDAKGWEKTIEYLGDYSCGSVYRQRRLPNLLKPFGEYLADDHEFHLYNEKIYLAPKGYHKYLYFREHTVDKPVDN